MPAATSAVRRLPFDALRSFTRLYRTYCDDYDALADFYAGDFRRPDARAAAADRAAAYDRDRDAVADVLLEQNAAWGLDDATRRHIEALRRPDAVAVVTGQQVGLATGPLYTLYKTLTALQLARQLAEETGRPVVPVFWVEGEDHDFDEIAGLTLLHRNERRHLRYDGARPGGNPGPVGRLVLDDDATRLLDAVDETLPPSDFKPRLMATLRDAYAPGTRLEDAFTKLMKAFFPDAGLVFLNPDDPRLKAVAAPLFRREIEDPEGVAERVRAVSERLEADYHAQVHVRPTNLFWLDDAGRLPIDAADGGFQLRGTDRRFTRDELLARLDEEPERFSPNVVLRPLMQDVLVPTAAYVAGPGEIAYFAQYRPVYAWAGVPMPVIYPRASATLVEGKVEKVLDRYGLTVADAADEPEQLFQRVVLEQMEVDVDAAFKAAGTHLHRAVNELKPVVESVDRSLTKSAEATRAALVKELQRLQERVVRAEKRHHDELRAQLDKAQVNLFPGGTPQERVLSPLYFLNKYGPDLLDELRESLSLDTTEHQVVTL